MKKFLALVIAAAWAGAAMASLYSYDSTGSETIDGVTWEYCVSNGEARVVRSTTLDSYCSSGYGNAAANWRAYFTSKAKSSSSYYSDYHFSYYYHSAISSSTTGAVAVPSKLGGYPVVAIDYYALVIVRG